MSNVPNLKNFQEDAVGKIVTAVKEILATKEDEFSVSSRKIVLDSPTGSGKTRMIADIIDRSLPHALTIVLSPGAGNLEQQTHNALKFFLSPSESVNVKDMDIPLFQNPAAPGTVVVKNWEALTTRNKKTGEYSVYLTKDGDNNNLFDWITASSNAGVPLAIIIDEAHYGNSKDAPAIQGFLSDITEAATVGGGDAPVVIEASATPILNKENRDYLYHEVKRNAVVAEGLMRKRGVLNDNIEDVIAELDDPVSVSAEKVLLTGALNKSNELNVEYRKVGSKQHALIAVQIPNSTPGKDAQDRVIKFFENEGMTLENEQVAIFTAQTKTGVIDDISSPDSPIRVLIYKQGIATGWDCPRAQVLVGFRHINSLIFSAQNLGRFSRATEARHYTLEESPTADLLNNFYVYSNISDMGLGYHPGKVKDGSSVPIDPPLHGDLDLINEFNAYNLPVSGLVREQHSKPNEGVIGRLLRNMLKERDYSLVESDSTGILLHTGSVETDALLDETVEEGSFTAITSQIGRASHEIMSRWNDLLLHTITDNSDSSSKPTLVEIFSRRLLTFYTARLRSEGESQEELRPIHVFTRMMQRDNFLVIEKVLISLLKKKELVVLRESFLNDPQVAAAADTRTFRFGGSFALPEDMYVDRIEDHEVKSDTGLAGKFLYREVDEDDKASAWRVEGLSSPERAFEKFIKEYTAYSEHWELAGIHKNAPYSNGHNFSIVVNVKDVDEGEANEAVTQNFFPDYIVFLRNTETNKVVPVVVEVKGNNPEGMDRNVAAKSRAAGQYYENTGLPFLIAMQKETGSETFRVYRENVDVADYLDLPAIRNASVLDTFKEHALGDPLPSDLAWMETLGQKEDESQE